MGIDKKIEPRIRKSILISNNIDELIKNIKTKKYSYNRIKRVLIYILIDYKKKEHNTNNYIRILGFNKKGKNYLASVKENIKIPIITNYSNSNNLIDIDIRINNILSIKAKKYDELKQVIIKIDTE